MVAAVMVRAESVSDLPIPLPVLDEGAEQNAPSNLKMLLEPQRVWSLRDFIDQHDRDADDDEQDEDDQTFLGPNNTTLHTSMSILQSLNQSRGATARGGGGRRGNKKLKPLDRDDLTQLQESFTVHLVQCLPALLSRYCDDDRVVAMLLECVSGLDMQLCALPAHQGEARKLVKDLINLLGQTQSPVVTRPLCLAVLHCMQQDSLRKPDVVKALQQAVAGVWEKIQLGRQALEDESSSLPDEAAAQGSKKKRRSSRASSSSPPAAAGASTASHRLLPLQTAVTKLRWLLFGGDCRAWVKLSEDELYDVLPELIDAATDFHSISTGEGLDLQPRFRIVCDAVYVLTATVLWRLHDVFEELRAHARAKSADKENENPHNSMRSDADSDGDSDGEPEANPVRGAIAALLSHREKLVDVITTLMNLTPMTGNPDELNTTSVSLFAQGEEDGPLPALESNYLHAIKRFCFALVGDLRALFKVNGRMSFLRSSSALIQFFLHISAMTHRATCARTSTAKTLCGSRLARCSMR